MKLNVEFVVRKVGENFLAVPVGEGNTFKGMINLNDTGAFIFEKLKEEIDKETLMAELIKEFDVQKADAEKDVDDFIDKLKSSGLLD